VEVDYAVGKQLNLAPKRLGGSRRTRESRRQISLAPTSNFNDTDAFVE
jgi:hypothetical protein